MVAPLKLPVRISLLFFLHVAAFVECSAFQSPDGDHTFVADGSGAALDAMSAGLAGAMRLLDTLHDIRGMLDELHVELDEIRQQQQLMRTEFEAMERRQSQDAGNEESSPFDRSPSGGHADDPHHLQQWTTFGSRHRQCDSETETDATCSLEPTE